MSALDFARALAAFTDGPDDDPEPEKPEYPCRDCRSEWCEGTCPESDVAGDLARDAELAMARELDAADLADATGDPLRDLVSIGDAQAARLNAFLAAGHPEPHIAAHHTCEQGGPCLPCAEYEHHCAEVDARERDRDRTR